MGFATGLPWLDNYSPYSTESVVFSLFCWSCFLVSGSTLLSWREKLISLSQSRDQSKFQGLIRLPPWWHVEPLRDANKKTQTFSWWEKGGVALQVPKLLSATTKKQPFWRGLLHYAETSGTSPISTLLNRSVQSLFQVRCSVWDLKPLEFSEFAVLNLWF